MGIGGAAACLPDLPIDPRPIVQVEPARRFGKQTNVPAKGLRQLCRDVILADLAQVRGPSGARQGEWCKSLLKLVTAFASVCPAECRDEAPSDGAPLRSL